jgi:VanZ family protein
LRLYSKLLLGWIIVSLILTWTPGEALPKPDFLDISLVGFLVHFGMFSVFSFLLTGIIYGMNDLEMPGGKVISLVIIWSLIFSLITETGQYFIPGRYFHGFDIMINFIGSLVGIGVFFLKFKYFSN